MIIYFSCIKGKEIGRRYVFMVIGYQIVTWIVLAVGIFYIFSTWKEFKWVQNVIVIRQVWYFLFVFGALVYWTINPTSIFTDWLNYLIVFIIFVAIDTFLILKMHLNKVGDIEVQQLTHQVRESSAYIKDGRVKMENMLLALRNYAYIEYYDSEEEYLFELDKLLQDFAEREDINIYVYEINQLLTNLDRYDLKTGERKKLLRTIENTEIYYGIKCNLVIQPFFIFNTEYYVLMETKEEPDDYDGLILGILLTTFDSSMRENQ